MSKCYYGQAMFVGTHLKPYEVYLCFTQVIVKHGTMVEHCPHHPKVKGSTPVACRWHWESNWQKVTVKRLRNYAVMEEDES